MYKLILLILVPALCIGCKNYQSEFNSSVLQFQEKQNEINNNGISIDSNHSELIEFNKNASIANDTILSNQIRHMQLVITDLHERIKILENEIQIPR